MISRNKIKAAYDRNQLIFSFIEKEAQLFFVCGGREGLKQILAFYPKNVTVMRDAGIYSDNQKTME